MRLFPLTQRGWPSAGSTFLYLYYILQSGRCQAPFFLTGKHLHGRIRTRCCHNGCRRLAPLKKGGDAYGYIFGTVPVLSGNSRRCCSCIRRNKKEITATLAKWCGYFCINQGADRLPTAPFFIFIIYCNPGAVKCPFLFWSKIRSFGSFRKIGLVLLEFLQTPFRI